MKIRLEKKKLVSYIVLLTPLFVIVPISLFAISLKREELRTYGRLFEHCTEETRNEKRCYVFLKDYEKKKGRAWSGFRVGSSI